MTDMKIEIDEREREKVIYSHIQRQIYSQSKTVTDIQTKIDSRKR